MTAQVNVRENENLIKVKRLFEDWEETMIWSCLQGVMGQIYVDEEQNPRSAKAILGDFVFLAGEPNEELLLHKIRNLTILTPQHEGWSALIERCLKADARRDYRYAVKKEKDVFDKALLEDYAARVPKEFCLALIDEVLFKRCAEQDFTRDFTSQFESYEQFQQYGLGVVALAGEEIVAGASAYSAYQEGIEVEIDTKPEYRRRGLALGCGARLILECLKRGLYPSWDAANLESVLLAERLGYHRGEAYVVYKYSKN